MATEIGAYEAKTHLPALLERASQGEQFIITKHGKAIARLGPVGGAGVERRRAAIEKIKEMRRGRILGMPVKDLIGEGRM